MIGLVNQAIRWGHHFVGAGGVYLWLAGLIWPIHLCKISYVLGDKIPLGEWCMTTIISSTYPMNNWTYNPLTKWDEPPSLDYLPCHFCLDLWCIQLWWNMVKLNQVGCIHSPLKNDGVCQLGWWSSQYIESHNPFHGSSHHQPNNSWFTHYIPLSY